MSDDALDTVCVVAFFLLLLLHLTDIHTVPTIISSLSAFIFGALLLPLVLLEYPSSTDDNTQSKGSPFTQWLSYAVIQHTHFMKSLPQLERPFSLFRTVWKFGLELGAFCCGIMASLIVANACCSELLTCMFCDLDQLGLAGFEGWFVSFLQTLDGVVTGRAFYE